MTTQPSASELAKTLLEPPKPGFEDVHYTTQAELILAKAYLKLQSRCDKLERVAQRAKWVNDNWNEFEEPGYGQAKFQEHLFEALKALDQEGADG